MSCNEKDGLMDVLDPAPAPAARRALALAVDACICAALYLILDLTGARGSRMLIFFIFTGWLCFAVPTARLGASPGMRAAGLMVTDLGGRRPRIVRASCRSLLSVLSTGLFGMGFMLFFLTRKRQTLHDMFTNTLVLDARRPRASLLPESAVVQSTEEARAAGGDQP